MSKKAKAAESNPESGSTPALFSANQTSVDNKVDAKITKADMANILSVKMLEGIEEEVRVNEENIRSVEKELHKIIAETSDIVNKKLTAIFKDNTVSVLREVKGYNVAEAFAFNKASENYTLEYKVVMQEDLSNSIKDKEFEVLNAPVMNSRFNVRYVVKDAKKVIDKYNTLKSEGTEIAVRLAKAKDHKYMRAQIDMAALASLPDGKRTVDSMNSLIAQLSSTIFAKKPAVPELSNS